MVKKIPIGGIEEFPGWEIHYDIENLYNNTTENACPHAYDIQTKTYSYSNGNTFSKVEWKVPRAVVAFNEAGYSQTSVCLDCIIEYSK